MSAMNEMESKVRQYFDTVDDSNQEILNQLILWSYANDIESDLYILGKLLPPEHLNTLVSYFDGGIIRFPNKKDYEHHSLIVLVYYLKEIMMLNWKQIKDYLQISKFDEKHNLSTISLGKSVLKFKDKLTKQLSILLDKVSIEDFQKQVLKTKDQIIKEKDISLKTVEKISSENNTDWVLQRAYEKEEDYIIEKYERKYKKSIVCMDLVTYLSTKGCFFKLYYKDALFSQIYNSQDYDNVDDFTDYTSWAFSKADEELEFLKKSKEE